MDASALYQPLKNSGDSFLNALRSTLDKEGKVASGKLRDSLKVKYTIETNSVTFELSGSYHWKFIDKGVDGTITKYGSPYKRGSKMPPLVEVRSWMDIKGIGTGADEAWKTFRMQKKWHEKGIKPTHIFTNEIENFKQNEIPKFLKALPIDIIKFLKNYGTNSNGTT